jgi:hypothetical protein
MSYHTRSSCLHLERRPPEFEKGQHRDFQFFSFSLRRLYNLISGIVYFSKGYQINDDGYNNNNKCNSYLFSANLTAQTQLKMNTSKEKYKTNINKIQKQSNSYYLNNSSNNNNFINPLKTEFLPNNI